MNGTTILETLQPIIRQAGVIMRSAHDHTGISSVIEKSGTANFVTDFDYRVQEYLINKISAAFPGAMFIAEEKANDPAVLATEYCFIIDPIDGTSNFIHNFHHSAISVALFSHGEAKFGAVYDPYMDEFFHAVKGGGAFVNNEPMHVSDFPLSTAIVSVGTCPYYKDKYTEPTFRFCSELFLKCSDVRRGGSAALDLAYLAAGRCDAFFEMLLSPWDVAAGFLLIEEAGGVISDMQGNPLRFDVPSSVLASNPVVYPELVALAQKY